MGKRKRDRARCGCVSLEGGAPCPDGLVSLWREGTLCDITIHVQSQAFSVHRVVLAGASDFMRALFTNDMSDSTAPKISEMSAEAFESALEWMYTGSCEVPEQSLPELLEAATRLQLHALQKAATRAIVASITPENAIQCWEMGERLGCPELEDAAKVIVLSKFEPISATAHFLTLPGDKLKSLLSDQQLCAEEEIVFRALSH